MPASDALAQLFMDAQERTDRLEGMVKKLTENTETAGFAYALREITFADAEAEITAGVTDWRIAIITDGRKTGEGVGAGTGCTAYLDQGQSPAVWLRFVDDTAVEI